MTLSMDDEAEVFLDSLAADSDALGRNFDPDTHRMIHERREDTLKRALAQSMRMQVAVGRRLLAYRKRDNELQQQAAMIAREYVEAGEALRRRIAEAEAFLDQIALLHREATGQTTLDIPGVGRWTTRRQPERFALDDAVLLRELKGDERAEYVEPRPTTFRVNTAKLRARLEAALTAAEASIQAADPQERERLRVATAENIAERFPGVQYIPAEVRVSHDLNL